MKTYRGLLAILITAGLIASCEPAEEELVLIDENAVPEVISSGHIFTEGPYWHPDGYLIFSDIPADRIYRWAPGEESEVYIEPSGISNGIQADIDGSILIAQHAGTLSRLTADGELQVIADTYQGNGLNSPNDIAVHSSGIIFFTDPPYGIELHDDARDEPELDFSGVFALTPDGELTVVYDEFDRPNGIVFSPSETRLYVNDSASGDITVFDVDTDGHVSNPRHFANVGAQGTGMGVADGMVVDTEGRLYSTGPAGISIFDPMGNHLQDVAFEQAVSNLEWKGDDPNIMFITSSDLVYRLEFNITGHKPR